MKKLSTLLLGAAALLLGTAPAPAQTYQQVWADEFDTRIGPGWQFETGGGGWGNNEKQYYQAANATVANGELRITARKENVGGYPYTSARLKTQGLKEFTYGKVEARIKLPLGQGLWPAFWMLGANIGSVGWPRCGEIDVMEHVNSENKVYGTIHWDANGYAQYGGNTPAAVADYHVYAVEWTPAAIKWFVDGVQYHEVNIANGTGSTEEFQRPFFLLLNLAVAGNWPGQTVDESRLPATMFVDYVRVYQLTNAPAGVATVYRNCNYDGAATALPVGDYTLGQLQARGIVNDDISSLRVNSGHQVVLYEHDNFQGASLTVGADNGCLVNNPLGAGNWNDKASSLRVQPVSAPAWSTTLQAEAFSAMQGVQVENTTDAGGGQNVGYIDATDWLAYYNVTFPTSGTYTIEYRVASLSGSRLSSDLNAGAIQLGNVDIPATGGWQTWTTVSQTVNVQAGTYNFGVYAQAGGWNLNWIRISRAGSNRTAVAGSGAATLGSPLAFSVHPNPTTDYLTLAAPAELRGGHLSVLNLRGKEVWRGTYDGRTVDVSALPPGLYTLVLLTPDQRKLSRRFSKQ